MQEVSIQNIIYILIAIGFTLFLLNTYTSIVKNKNFQQTFKFKNFLSLFGRFSLGFLRFFSLNQRETISARQYVELLICSTLSVIILAILLSMKNILFIHVLLGFIALEVFEIRNIINTEGTFNLDYRFFNKFFSVVLSCFVLFVQFGIMYEYAFVHAVIFIVLATYNFDKNVFRQYSLLGPGIVSVKFVFFAIILLRFSGVLIFGHSLLDLLFLLAGLVPVVLFINTGLLIRQSVELKLLKLRYVFLAFLLLGIWILQLLS